MSFWSGVVQGVKDIDVLKEKEALANERKGVRDEATARYDESIAYRDRMQQIADDRNALIEGRAVEAHGVAMATAQLTISQKIAGLAGGTGVGTRTGGGGGKVPTPQAMEAGQRALRARIDKVGGLDEMSTAQQTYYKPILDNVAASYELNNLLEAAVGDDTDLSVLTAVDRVKMVAVVAAQGQEAFAEFKKTAAEDGWDATEVAEAMRLAESVNPAFAELVLMTPSKDNLTEQEQYKSLEQQLMVHAGIWLQSNERTKEVNTALNQFSSGNAEVKSRGMATLIGLGVGQDWIYGNTPESSLLRSLSGPQVSAVPTVNEAGALVPAGSSTTPADIRSFDSEADILKLPIDEQAALVGQRVTIGDVTGVMEGVPDGAPQLPEGLGGEVHPRDLAGLTGEAREAERQRILRKRADAIVEPTERASAAIEGTVVQADLNEADRVRRMSITGDRASVVERVAEATTNAEPTRSEGYRPTQTGPTELNLPKILEALTPETRKAVEAELQEMPSARAVGTVGFQDLGAREGVPSSESPSAGQGTTTLDRQSSMLSEDLNDVARSTGAGENLSTDRSAGPQMALQDLNQEDFQELAVGVEAIAKALQGISDGSMGQDELDNLILELQKKFTPDALREALDLAMNQ